MANIKENVLTQELVKELFDYHEDGHLTWKISRTVKIKIGQRAGSIFKTTRGTYRYAVRIGSEKSFYVSRIIFLWHKGWLPDFIDHRDRDTTNNKIENLRAATAKQNSSNRTKKKNTTSKYLGVSYVKKSKTAILKTTGQSKTWVKYKWVAQITVNSKRVCLGYYNNEIEAAKAFNKAASLHYGEFANLNVI